MRLHVLVLHVLGHLAVGVMRLGDVRRDGGLTDENRRTIATVAVVDDVAACGLRVWR
jgi:hypothetical protein